MTRVFRGVIVGSGNIGRHAHLPAFRTAPVRERVEIAGFLDAASDGAPVEGLPHLREPAQVATLGKIDFLDVCTPTASHRELILWGLSRGWHVLCEKPVALTLAEADELARAARDAGRILVPCHQYRFNPAWTRIAEWLRAGRIGAWHLAEFSVHRSAADPGGRPSGTPWRGTRAAGKGGVLLDHGTHLIYQLLDVAGMPSAVGAWTGRLRHDYDVEDTASLVFEYPDRVATMFLTWAGGARRNGIRFTGECGVIELENGELRLDSTGGKERVDLAAELDKSVYHRWFARLFERFAGLLAAGRADQEIEDIRRVAAVLETGYAAAASRATLPVPALG
ncbi:MAG TPA: Gfo/Idh/MocA family oxidoreductase [Gemmatimonadales bacterium]|nr:Gfo/Idh/MocA family oxidoreductase [Gemmatimonadales bacterium]